MPPQVTQEPGLEGVSGANTICPTGFTLVCAKWLWLYLHTQIPSSEYLFLSELGIPCFGHIALTIITICTWAVREGQKRADQSTARALNKRSERLIGSVHQKCAIPAAT